MDKCHLRRGSPGQSARRPQRVATLWALLALWAVGDMANSPAMAYAQKAPAGWPDLQAQMDRRVGGGARDAAVVVAVQNYTYISDVPGALQNAQDWEAWLTRVRGVPKDSVELLTDQKVTPGRLVKAANLAALQVKSGGTLWFVFIGHGVVGADGEAMFVSVDARQSDEVYAQSVARSKVAAALAAGSQHRTVLVADTCFSGGGDHAGKRFVTNGQAMVPMKDAELGGSMVVLAAGGADQQTGPLPGTRRPAYSYLLLGAMMGWADGAHDDRVDGKVTVGEARHYAQAALARLEERTQEPQFQPGTAGGQVLTASGGVRGPRDLKGLMALPMLAPAEPAARVAEVVCPAGTRAVEGRCVVQAVSCPADTRLVAGQCEATVSCPAGTSLVDGRCEALMACPEGTRLRAGRCVGEASCPAGTAFRDGQCVVAKVVCPAGTTVADGKCVAAVSCPSGSRWDGSRCVGEVAEEAPQPAHRPVPREAVVTAAAGPEGMVVISREPALFAMGGPGWDDNEKGPGGGAVQVTLSKGYALDLTEVTVAAYGRCVAAGRCEATATPYWAGKAQAAEAYCNYGEADKIGHPMNCVDWRNAEAYCAWAGKRLPTEAEWEYAARGDGRTYVWGNGWPPPRGAGNFADVAFKQAFPTSDALAGYDDGHAGTAPVGSFGADWRGMSDMAGNVWEWVADAKEQYSGDSLTDPKPQGNSESARVFRGGSWDNSTPRYLRAANRFGNGPMDRFNNLGFRCARTI